MWGKVSLLALAHDGRFGQSPLHLRRSVGWVRLVILRQSFMPFAQSMHGKNNSSLCWSGSCSTDSSSSDSPPCPKVDTSPWRPEKAGVMSIQLDSLELDVAARRKFCICAKTSESMYKPGNRFIAHLEPERIPDDVPCPGNHTCVIVGKSLHITG